MHCNIIYEDKQILVVHKPAGIAVETKRITEADLVTELRNYLASKGCGTYLAPINRLDQPVEGLVLFALNEPAARELSRQLQAGEISKIYKAIVFGTAPDNGDLTDYLIKNKDNTSTVVTPETREAKKAHLTYEKLRDFTTESGCRCSVLKINLDTGRHHQIRVQLSHAGYPIMGDLKYGSEESVKYSKILYKTVQLAACELSFIHPKTKKQLQFNIEALGEG